jgi:hypothetical protein
MPRASVLCVALATVAASVAFAVPRVSSLAIRHSQAGYHSSHRKGRSTTRHRKSGYRPSRPPHLLSSLGAHIGDNASTRRRRVPVRAAVPALASSEVAVVARVRALGVNLVPGLQRLGPGRYAWHQPGIPLVLRQRYVQIGAVERLHRKLDLLHQQGIFHRNISPRTVLVDQYGELSLVSWSAAVVTRAAPEQAEGLASDQRGMRQLAQFLNGHE